MPRRARTLAEWLTEHIQRGAPDECWPWLGKVDSYGYGQFRLGGRNGRTLLAHREALRASGVEVPDRAEVPHSCDNPPCCNPAHLKVSDHATNMAEMVARKRSRNGESSAFARYTDAQIAEIRASGETNAVLARRFGMSDGYISQIRRNLRRVTPTNERYQDHGA